MITYQHVAFIAQAIESVLMQKADFPIQLILGEDGSTDGTREICRSYAEKYPEIIKLICRDRSDPARAKYAAPFMHNFVETLKACSGKYIALLEGDDYWTDPLKLQKQVDFLEAHPECVMCHHNVVIVSQENRFEPYHIYVNQTSVVRGRYQFPHPQVLSSGEGLVLNCYISTASVVYRNVLGRHPLPALYAKSPVGDWPLFLHLTKIGKIGYLPQVMATYRINAGSVWSSQNPRDINRLTYKVAQCLAEDREYSFAIRYRLLDQFIRRSVQRLELNEEDYLKDCDEIIETHAAESKDVLTLWSREAAVTRREILFYQNELLGWRKSSVYKVYFCLQRFRKRMRTVFSKRHDQ